MLKRLIANIGAALQNVKAAAKRFSGLWVGGDGLQRVLGSRDSDEALAAHLAGQWRRAPEGEPMLRVDAVVQWLGVMPCRHEPRMLKLRHYRERDVLLPAQRRRQRCARALPLPTPPIHGCQAWA